MDRTILHCDLNNFYASCELLSLPELKDKPVAVCGDPKSRHGIILSKNEIAKKFGVKTAETIWQAKKKCPDLVLLSPHYDLYSKYSKLAIEIYERFTDIVEPYGIDEAWLDITYSMHLFGNDGKLVADTIRKVIKSELGLTISVGVSFNKVFAKLGSDYKKPDATTVIDRNNYKEVVYPLSILDLFYVGKRTGDKLLKFRIKTIGELASFDKKILSTKLGKIGELLWEYANGIDESPVISSFKERKIKSVGNGMTFKRDLKGLQDIKAGVIYLSDSVATRLREYGLKSKTIRVMIKDPRFKTISRQKKVEQAIYLAKEISEVALEIIKTSWNFENPIRSLTITGTNLVEENEPEQLLLFDEKTNKKKDKQEKIEKTLDNIRSRFGKKAVLFGAELKEDLGINSDDESD